MTRNERVYPGLPQVLLCIETHIYQRLVSVVPVAVRAVLADRTLDVRLPALSQLGLVAGAGLSRVRLARTG